MANAYVRMRHPDYDTLRGMLDDVGRTVHVQRVTRRMTTDPARPATVPDHGRGRRALLGVEGPVATVTAGWQEREGDDAELDDGPGRPVPQPGPLSAG